MASELDEMLRRGIAAAKAGQREMARDLLMRVVEQDERNKLAWLWLSGVVDRPDDREICLENVLALDPDNQAARRGLEQLRQQAAGPARPSLPPKPSFHPGQPAAPSLASAILRGAPEGAAPSDPPEAQAGLYAPPPVSQADGDRPAASLAGALLRGGPGQAAESAPSAQPYDWMAAPSNYPSDPEAGAPESGAPTWTPEFDDEYLCPYCAHKTAPQDKRCPACDGVLWRTSPKRASRSWRLWMIIVLTGWEGVLSLAVGVIMLVASRSILQSPSVNLWSEAPALFGTLMPILAGLYVLVGGINLGLALLFYLRWKPIYWIAFVLTGLNLMLLLVNSLNNLLCAGFAVVLGVLQMMFLLSIQDDFTTRHERLLSLPDKGIRTHSEYYMHGRQYARQKMWTLAAIHFQRAVGGAPSMVAYYLALASAYACLKRYERAQSVLCDARQLAPENPDVRALAEQIADLRNQ